MKGKPVSEKRKTTALLLLENDQDIRKVAKRFRVKPKTLLRWKQERGYEKPEVKSRTVAPRTARDVEPLALLRQAGAAALAELADGKIKRLLRSQLLAMLALQMLEGT